MITILPFLFYIALVTCYELPWETRELSDFDLNEKDFVETSNLVSITSEITEQCAMDRLTLSIRSLINTTQPLLSSKLVIKSKESTKISIKSIFPSIIDNSLNYYTTIQCLLNKNVCIPKITDIIADLDSKRLSIHFLEETNEPSLTSTYKLMTAFDFQPNIIGVCIGEWITPKLLNITIEEKYLLQIIESSKLNKVKISIRFHENLGNIYILFI